VSLKAGTWSLEAFFFAAALAAVPNFQHITVVPALRSFSVDSQTRILKTDRGDHGHRLDLVLRRHLADLVTRTRAQTWIQNGRVAVNGVPVRRAAARAAPGDVVTVVLPERTPEREATGNSSSTGVDQRSTNDGPPLSILYEDEFLLAVDKPAGVVVHPSYRQPVGTLMDALRRRARHWPEGTRPSLVGRLDKLTSGVIVVARTAAIHAALQSILGSSRSAKEYLAVVYGRVPVRGQIALRLAADPRDRRRVAVSEGGVASVTRFARLARVRLATADLSLLRCRLVTGRKHQIRVHLAARGWPLVGDPIYGRPLATQSLDTRTSLVAELRSFPRQALHAWRIACLHPVTGRPLVIEAPIPPDVEGLLNASGLSSGLDALRDGEAQRLPLLAGVWRC
jgi:23S rRNA pseudouridine1911/1915/1917 synthase